jgi:hypothetical protein
MSPSDQERGNDYGPLRLHHHNIQWAISVKDMLKIRLSNMLIVLYSAIELKELPPLRLKEQGDWERQGSWAV